MRGLLAAGGVPVGNDQPRSLARKHHRRRPPEPRPATGNQCDSALKRRRKVYVIGAGTKFRVFSHIVSYQLCGH